jgi:hypothetical protein
MPGLRLARKNIAADLRPTKDDLLIAGWTPGFDGTKLRIVRMRVAENGVAERAVDDIACVPGNFWHTWTLLPAERMAELRAALAAAQTALKRVKVTDDENGRYRLIDCRIHGRRAVLKMRYLDGAAEHDVPEFETAWSMIVGLFPDVTDNSQRAASNSANRS